MGKRRIKLAFKESSLSISEASSGAVLSVSGWDKHLTLVVEGYRLTFHETEQRLGLPSERRPRRHLFAADLAAIEERASRAPFRRTAAIQLRRMRRRVRSAEHLRDLGIHLVLPDREFSLSSYLRGRTTIDVPGLIPEPTPFSELWQTSPGSAFYALDCEGRCLGLLLRYAVRDRTHLYLIRLDKIYEFCSWLFVELAGSNARPIQNLLHHLCHPCSTD